MRTRRRSRPAVSVFIVVILLAVIVSVVHFLLPGGRSEPVFLQMDAPDELRGILVRSYNNEDLPSAPGLDTNTFQEEIENVISQAEQLGLNTLYYEISPCADAIYNSRVLPTSYFFKKKQGEGMLFSFDPLQYLLEKAHEANLRVIGVINPFLVSAPVNSSVNTESLSEEHLSVSQPDYVKLVGNSMYIDPTVDGAIEHIQAVVEDILSGYAVDGIFFEDFSLPDQLVSQNTAQALSSLLSGVSRIVKQADESLTFGVDAPAVDSTQENPPSLEKQYAQQISWMQNGVIDYIAPEITGETTGENADYEQNAQWWGALSAQTDIPVYCSISPERWNDLSDVTYQLFLNREYGVSGYLVHGLNRLKSRSEEAQAALIRLNSTEISQLSLSDTMAIPTDFAITRPTEKIWVTYSHYFILGTSDPEKELTLDGEPVELRAQGGTFGVYVSLEEGENTFTFAQGDETQTVTIVRYTPDDTPTTIDTITKSSIYPVNNDAVYVSEPVELSCIAPAGARVTATFNGTTVELEQVAVAEEGIPATFTGEIQLPEDTSSGKVTDLGKVVYDLYLNDTVTSFTSQGSIFAVGEGASLKVRINNYLASVYADKTLNLPYYATLIEGSTDYVTEINNDSFKLSMGGCVVKEYCDIITDDRNIDNVVSSVILTVQGRSERFVLSGTASPAFQKKLSGDTLTFTLYNTTGVTLPDLTESSLISDMEITEEDGDTTIEIKLTDAALLWGYDVEYEGNNTILYLKRKPTLSDDPVHPLDGVVIAVDAGHGGDDGGALGAAGTTGPQESDVNLSLAQVTASYLRQLGAEVVMLRPDDTEVFIEERYLTAQDAKVDFFLSIHHNSLAETTDAGKVSGVEVHYHEDISIPLAETMLQSLVDATGRKNRGIIESNFLVNRMTYAPSILMEIGFMGNPYEYEQVCNPFMQYKTAVAIAQGVLDTLK